MPNEMPETSVLNVEAAAEGVRELVLNRPEVHNALNVPLLDALAGALREAEADGACRVLLLRGEGKSFCAGLDLKVAADPAQAQASTELLSDLLTGLRASRLIVVTAVHGAAYGGGAGLLMASDLTVADETLKVGFPEVRRGIIPAMVSVLLRQNLGDRLTRDILLLGQTLTADRVAATGLLGVAAAPVRIGAAREEAMKRVDELLLGGPETLAATKRLVNEIGGEPFDAAWQAAHAAHLASRVSEEFAEGSRAFKEKRPPAWAPAPIAGR